MDLVPMKDFLLTEAAKLSVQERIELIEAIWDTVAADLDGLPIPESHKEELDRRLAEMEANPGAESTWEEVRTRLEQTR